jgi:hypothetical protein
MNRMVYKLVNGQKIPTGVIWTQAFEKLDKSNFIAEHDVWHIVAYAKYAMRCHEHFALIDGAGISHDVAIIGGWFDSSNRMRSELENELVPYERWADYSLGSDDVAILKSLALLESDLVIE